MAESEDISARINQLLSDPESVEKIRSIASALTAQKSADGTQKRPEPPKSEGTSTADLLAKLLPLLGEFSEGEKDSKVQLLRALKPYLAGEREKRMDDAVLILKLAQVASKALDLDIIKDLNFFKR